MAVEAQRYQPTEMQQPHYLRNPKREVRGSEAFNLNYDAAPTRDELRRDIVSYLAEYRLQVPTYNYTLIYGRDASGRGPITLRDQDRGESMQFKTKRVIEERRLQHKPIHREESEDTGLASLNEQLRSAQTGDTIIWGSPPGPKDQGYGEYGFLYAGKVTKQSTGEASLAMSAIRIENPTIEQFNNALSAVTGESVMYEKAEEFLSTPKVIPQDVPQGKLYTVLKQEFAFVENPKEKKKWEQILDRMNPMIEEFLDFEHDDEKLKAFYSLENYALALKEEQEQEGEIIVYQHDVGYDADLDGLMDRYGYVPPKAAGSCGSTGSSNGLVSAGGSAASVAAFGVEGGKKLKCNKCPLCGASDIVATIAYGRITCPSCRGSAEYAC